MPVTWESVIYYSGVLTNDELVVKHVRANRDKDPGWRHMNCILAGHVAAEVYSVIRFSDNVKVVHNLISLS